MKHFIMKRIPSMVLSVCLLVCSVSIPAFASAEAYSTAVGTLDVCSYAVTPADGEVVDFHTALQSAYLSDPYTDGIIGTPESITLDSVTYPIDGNPFSSTDLETRYRMHDDWSLPEPITLTWEGPASYSYCIQISPDECFEEDVRAFTTTENKLDVFNLYIGTVYYWRVAPSEDQIDLGAVHSFTTASVGPRNLYIDGVTNVRDIGGFELADGSGFVRQGLLYRGGRLNLSNIDDDVSIFSGEPDYFRLDITEEGLDTLLNDLGVKTELDVRVAGTTNEIANMDNTRIEGLEYVNIPLDYMGGTMTDNNLTRLDNPQRIKEIFELLADEDNYPIYFHCNIGTDRTGVISYLLGALLGMEEEDLYVNYVFSNFGNISGSTKSAGRQSSTITGPTGYGTTVDSYPGETLSERTEAALMDICGLSRETLDSIREIFIEYYE